MAAIPTVVVIFEPAETVIPGLTKIVIVVDAVAPTVSVTVTVSTYVPGLAFAATVITPVRAFIEIGA